MEDQVANDDIARPPDSKASASDPSNQRVGM